MQWINVAHRLSRSRANGPGERFVLWVQGCGLACDGCWNPDTWSFAPKEMVSPDELLAELDQVGTLDGVTLTGGEPFAQAAALVPFVRGVRERGLSVVVFTGHTLAELRSAASTSLLQMTNVLVAGRFNKQRRSIGPPLLGSTNQRVHFLSDRYSEKDLSEVATCEAHVASDGSVSWTGFPSDFIDQPSEQLNPPSASPIRSGDGPERRSDPARLIRYEN